MCKTRKFPGTHPLLSYNFINFLLLRAIHRQILLSGSLIPNQ